ncbi:MAG: hypothetical protein GY846_12960, partial [Deltaproteobacteria bacterium]|nr:hypothetical protein [Deltaproteobacteria bacterium]
QEQLVSIDVVEEKKGGHFIIHNPNDQTVEVLDVRPALRHLLLMVRGEVQKGVHKDLRRFLCGHDERHWFVAAIPEDARVSTVTQAMEALKPKAVQGAQEKAGVKAKHRTKRKTAGYVRQGEWFFIPRKRMKIPELLVLQNEPLRRGNGKPHMAQFLYRKGGKTVYVCGQHPNGLTEKAYQKLLAENAQTRHFGWRIMQRDPDVFVKGRITHPDHATVVLDVWHRVSQNTEARAVAFRDVAFLD